MGSAGIFVFTLHVRAEATVLCLGMQSSDFTGAQILGETFLEP